jgi:hypothetical protein
MSKKLQLHKKIAAAIFLGKKAAGGNLSSCLSQVDAGQKKDHFTLYVYY